METIFTLIIVLLPVIFKLIGKKLEKSAAQPQETDEQHAPIEDWAEVLRRHIEAQQQQQEEARPAAPVQQPVQQRVAEEGVPQTRRPDRTAPRRVKPILQEEEQRPKEKIDKKKLIMYSEIMKPKYTE